MVSQSSGLFDWNTLRYWLAKCWHFHGDHSNLIAVLFRSFFVAIYLQLQRNVGAALMEATPIENVTLFFYVGILFFLSFLISLFLSLSLFSHLFPSLSISLFLLKAFNENLRYFWLVIDFEELAEEKRGAPG